MTTMKDLINDFGINCTKIQEETHYEIMDLYYDENGKMKEDLVTYDPKEMMQEKYQELLDELMEELKKFYE